MKAILVLLFLIVGCYSQTTIKNVVTKQISTVFNGPIAVEFYFPTNNIIVSSYYYNGLPHNFRKIDSSGVQSQWSTVSGEIDEIMMAIVRNGNTAGFTVGDIFTGNGNDGEIQRVTDGGNTVVVHWCSTNAGISGGVGLLRGALEVDKWNNGWGHQLYICTTGGYMFKILAGSSTCGTVTRIGTGVGVHLEGITTVPVDTRYGVLSDSVIVGSETNGRLYYVTSAQPTVSQSIVVGCDIEDLDIVLPNQNYFVINYGSGRLLGIDYTQWKGHEGKIVAVQEGDGTLWEIMTPTGANPYCSKITYDPNTPAGDKVSGSFEQAVFAPAGVAEILPADFSLCLQIQFDTTVVTANAADYNTVKFTSTNTGYTNYNYNGANSGSPIVPSTSFLARGNVYFWFGQDYKNEFSLTIYVLPSGPGAITLSMSSSALGSNAYYVLQNNAADSYYFVQSTGVGSFTWTYASNSVTSGTVIGPINFLDATTLMNAQFTVTSVSGGITGWQFVGSQTNARTNPPIKFWPASPQPLSQGSIVKINRVPCNCGNNVVEKFEQCDNGANNGQLGQCCSASCTFLPVSFLCRNANSQPCDAADYCSGNTAVCTDKYITDGRQCSATIVNGTGQCGYCPGNSAACGSAIPTCPTCSTLKNCSGHGVCSTVGGSTQCICDTSNPSNAYGGPYCDVPLCSNLTNCGSCAAHPACGWCCKEQSCVPGSSSAPDPAYNATCDSNYYRGTPDLCFCNGTRTCTNGGSCDICGDCNCVPPFGGPTCNLRVDCLGVLGGNATNDLCGCNKGNVTCIGCDGIPFGKVYDKCGVCGGDGTTCYKICGYDACLDCASAENCAWCIHKSDSGLADACVNTAKDDTSTCDALLTDRDNCGFTLTTSAIVGITGGILALIIIIVIIVVAAIAAGGGYAGYKYWSKYRGKFGAASSNPLYTENKTSGVNPLFEQKD